MMSRLYKSAYFCQKSQMMKGNSVLQFLAKLDKTVAFFNNFAYCPTLIYIIERAINRNNKRKAFFRT